MAFWHICGFLFVIFACGCAYATDTCVKQSACICHFPNGTGIDLTPAASANFSVAENYYYSQAEAGAQFIMATYYYHPCYDVNMSSLINATVPSQNNSCTDPLSICRHVNTMILVNATTKMYKLDEGALNFMGRSSISTFSVDGGSIIYANGPSQTTVYLKCAETDNQLQVYSIADPRNIELAFYSRDACLKQIEASGRSLGSTLLIIFFAFVIFYLVLGICTKKFLMGATGIEVIPNLGFWSELPNLVRDGWLFMISGFKLPARASGQTVSPDPNSYDSI